MGSAEKKSSSSSQELVSGAKLSENCTIPQNLLEFRFSFGYDCKRIFNLCLIERDVLVFASGNLIHFFTISTGQIQTRRSAYGGGIGYITKNPVIKKYPSHLTVAENGQFPPIIIYKYPSMEKISVLNNGSTRSYTKLDYSPDGELLASQAGEPDYQLTVWNWKKMEMILRSQSFSNDVVNVKFSLTVPGQLTTAGSGHIKFWKMAQTFTGLKLQGNLGRFGKTEICDIIGIYSMPDEKVLSGSEWGNILVWDGGIIKVEVCRKGRKHCHNAPITQILMQNGQDVITVGQDGYVRIWFWETVELADPPEDDRVVEIEPIYEYKIGSSVLTTQLMGMVKMTERTDNYKWYAQDGNGGIWECDISPENIPAAPKQLFKCHAGQIVSLQTSPISKHVATLGKDGRILVYNYDQQQLLFEHQFVSEGRDMIWVPVSIDPTGVVLIIGFSDGVVRLVTVDLAEKTATNRVQFIQILKPHSKGITKMSINTKETILVTASEDKTIFIHQLDKRLPYMVLKPIGLVNLPSIPTALSWKPDLFARILIGCLHGEVLETDLPESPRSYTNITYSLDHIELRTLVFKSTKSQIRRNIRLQVNDERKAAKLLKKTKSLERLRKDNPGVEIDEKTFLEDSDTEEELEDLYIPPKGSPVLWLQYTPRDTIWLSMGGYDAGYVYEFEFDSEDPVQCTMIPHGDDIEIHSYLYFDEYLIFGMGDGAVRINKIKDDFTDLSDYYLLHMHDNFNGKMSICFSYDNKCLFTAGSDGNLFSYDWNAETKDVRPINPFAAEQLQEKVYDIDNPKFLSLEQQKQKDDYDHRMRIANNKKESVLKTIDGLKDEYLKILKRNKQLPGSQQLTVAELEIDPRITADLDDQLRVEMNLVQRKMAFEVEKEKLAGQKLMEYFIEPLESFPIEVIGISSNTSVKTIRIQKLTDEFFGIKEDLKERIQKEQERTRIADIMEGSYIGSEDEQIKMSESFLYGLSESTRLESKMKRLLNKYRERKAKEEKRKLEWQQVNSEKPDIYKNHPDDDKALQEADNAIGDYKLKTDKMYDPPEDIRDTTHKKFEELLKIREEIYQIRNNFNIKVFNLRDKKLEIHEYINKKSIELKDIQQFLSDDDKKYPETKVKIDESREYPEKLLDLEYYSKKDVSPSEQYENAESTNVGDTMRPEEVQRIILQPIDEKYNFLDSNVVISERMLIELKELELRENENTAYEKDLLTQQHRKNLFKQDKILSKINQRIKLFDNELETLSEQRLQVQVEAKFLDNYLLTLNQELWLLKDFEKLEENLIVNVEDHIIARNNLHKNIQHIKASMEMKRKLIEKEKEGLKYIMSDFKNQCMGDKFSSFLKKIFKKKYRPPKEHDADTNSSADSSSSSESEGDDDANSVDSLELGFMFLDENKCPTGCNHKLYELAFLLREKRYKCESEIRDAQVFIENSRTEMDQLTRKFSKIQAELDESKSVLYAFRRDKQKMLNQVETLVILRMDQIQHFSNEEDFAKIENTLLFHNANVNKLYNRVGQIALETLETKRKHRVNVFHLARMNTDIKFMEQQIVDLKDEINGTMMKKFGRIVDLDELEENILRRMVYEMRANVNDVKKEYAHKISAVNREFSKKQDQLKNVLQRLTEKLNILTVLEEEKNYLQTVVSNQQKMLKKPGVKRIDFSGDLKKLKEISSQQVEEIAVIQREIQTLTVKCKPLTPSPVCGSRETRKTHLSALSNHVTRDHEESIILNMLKSQVTSSRVTSPDNEFVEEICAVVEQFLVKNLSQFVKPNDLIEIQENIVRYLVNVGSRFESDFSDDFLQQIIEGLKSFIPKKYVSAISLKDLAQLVQDVVQNFGEISMVDPKRVTSDIISNTLSSITTLTTKQDYTESVILEILKQMFATLSAAEIKCPDRASQIRSVLVDSPNIVLDEIDEDKIVDEIVSYSINNMLDNVDESVARSFVEELKRSDDDMD